MNNLEFLKKVVINNRTISSINKEDLLCLPTINFLITSLLLTPQKRGPLLQERLKLLNKWKSSNDRDRGDCQTDNGDYIEIKGSYLESCDSIINLVQIRPWQQVNYLFYCLNAIDLENLKMSFFYLKKEQMIRELELFPFQASHGTNNVNSQNEYIERSIRIKPNSIEFKRWNSKYSKDYKY
jgi:hypothetical protein